MFPVRRRFARHRRSRRRRPNVRPSMLRTTYAYVPIPCSIFPLRATSRASDPENLYGCRATCRSPRDCPPNPACGSSASVPRAGNTSSSGAIPFLVSEVRPMITLVRRAATIAALLPLAMAPAAGQRVQIKLDPSVASGPLTGRVFVFFSRNETREPRLQGGSYGGSVPFFGLDVSALKPGATATIDAKALGYPYDNLSKVPAGDYYAQALLNVYTEFKRADGHTIWVHNDQWEGQHFNTSPGNLVSEVVKVHFDPKVNAPITMTLARTLPAITVPPDTRWVKRIKIRSELLSKFWGRPMYIGATMLLPKGFDEEPSRRYPAIYDQGHFGLGAPFGFSEDSAAGGRGGRGGRGGAVENPFAELPTTARESGYAFAQRWKSDDFPRYVAITWQHPTPYYDDSYAVNSVNNGPYQEALLTELVPLLEKQ